MPFTDMQPTDQNDPQKKFVLHKAPANMGGSDSNDGSLSHPIATFNEYWRRLFDYNLNGCWPWLNLLPTDATHTHADSMDADCYPPGAPGWDTTNPGAGAGSKPVISGAWPGHPLGGTSEYQRDNCVVTGAPGKVAFSAIYGANYVVVYVTGNTPGRDFFSPGEYGIISGGNNRMLSCKYYIGANGGKYIGDGGVTFAPGITIGGVWTAAEGGEVKMLNGVNVTFEGATTVQGQVASATHNSYIRVAGVNFVNPHLVSGSRYISVWGSGIAGAAAIPGSGQYVDLSSWAY